MLLILLQYVAIILVKQLKPVMALTLRGNPALRKGFSEVRFLAMPHAMLSSRLPVPIVVII
jgi:hypothetical protein